MAEEAKEGAAPAEAKPKGKKKLIIIIVVVLLLVGIGVGAFLALGSKSEEGAEDEEHAAAAEGEEGAEGEHGEESAAGAIFPLDVFIVNLQVKGSFLKAAIQLEFATPEPPHTIENDVPKIRDAIIRVLSSRSAAEILNPEGKEKLRGDVMSAVNEAIGSDDVVQVYFTDFIVQ